LKINQGGVTIYIRFTDNTALCCSFLFNLTN